MDKKTSVKTRIKIFLIPVPTMDEDAKMIRAANGAKWAKRADDNDLQDLSDLLKGLDVETRQDTNEDGKYRSWSQLEGP